MPMLAEPAAKYRAAKPVQLSDRRWPDAVLAGTSAALLHGMPVPREDRVHVVVPTARADRRRLVAHRHRLDPDDTVVRAGVRLTAPARTVVDCLGVLDATTRSASSRGSAREASSTPRTSSGGCSPTPVVAATRNVPGVPTDCAAER